MTSKNLKLLTFTAENQNLFMKSIKINAFFLASIFFFACNSSSDSSKIAQQAAAEIEQESSVLKIYPANSEVDYPKASLKLNKHQKNDSDYTFNYQVENYELQSQTTDATHQSCANSGKGQHIHFIVNNAPYKAKYTAEFNEKLSAGTNVILSFLSRSYHLSVKNKNAFDLSVIESSDVKTIDFDRNAAHLFYSRPKGTYKKADAQKVLVDFYLINTTLSSDGNKVLLLVDGEEFLLDSWQPYFIEGLSQGEHRIQIKLVDNDGQFIDGPFNDSKERIITIEQ